jgi:hypothetical protein
MQPSSADTSRCAVALTIAALLLAGCGSSTEPTASAPTASPSPPAPTLTYLALGDSWPEGAHCGYCRTFAGLHADGLGEQTGRKVIFNDRTGGGQAYFEELGGGSESLLKALRSDKLMRQSAREADVIMIATGPNELGIAYEPAKSGTCGGKDDKACFRKLGRLWNENFDAILREIETLRAGKPTAVRLVDAANAFLWDKSLREGMPKTFARTGGALIYKLLNDALCRNAAKHHAVCVDVRPIINGRSLDQPGDENSPESMRAVAEALLATEVPELDGGAP